MKCLNYKKAYSELGFSEDLISMIGIINDSNQFFDLGLTEILQQKYTLDSEISYYIKDGMIKLPLSLYEALINDEKYSYKYVEASKLGKVTIKMESPVEGIFNSIKNNKISLKYKDKNRDGVLLSSYSWGEKSMILGNEDYELQINDAIRYLEKLYGIDYKYIINNLINYKSIICSDVQYIWGGAAFSKPGYKTRFSNELTRPEMNNKLFFAGEHISQKHGTQQGALQSGMTAAYNISKSIIEKNNLYEVIS